MINFNEDLSLKQIIKIIIPILFLLSAIVIYSLVIKPSLNEIEAMEEGIKEKNEAIAELAEDSTKSDELEYNTATEIKAYDNYIDFFTEELINKKFKYGNIMPKQLDTDEVIYPYEVETKLIFEDIKAFYDILDNASHNLTGLNISKKDDGWEADIKNIFLMDQYYGLRNIVIDNIGIESSDDVSDDEEEKDGEGKEKDGEGKEKDEEKNDEQKKESFSSSHNGGVEINEKTGKIRLFEIRTVVDDLEDEDLEVSLDEAHDINPNYQVGDIVETEADVDHIGRLAAIQTKQLFRQKIRETEKETLYNEFADKKDDIITGIVDRVEPKFAIINIGKTGAFLGLNQQIPGETLHEGQHVKVYVSDVDRGTKGTHIVVSRTEPQFVRRLFELEVPEVYDGTVEIKSVSREPGERSKIAVYTAVEGLDPIGSCVGPKGSRVKNVVDELHGEMIDIVEWSSDPVVYISHALSPSDVLTVSVDEEKHSALVIVPDDQLSLAIGKRGQNARLAVRLTGWKIDIKSLSEATELGLMEQIQQKEELPVDETFQDEFAQEMLDNQEEKETVVEEKENIENEVEEVTSESDVEDYEDFDDYEDDEYSKYDEDIDYDEYDKYYDED